MGNEVPEKSADRGSGDESPGPDQRDLWSAGSDDNERACIEGSCTPIRIDTAAGNEQPSTATIEGEERLQVDAGISASEEEVLGRTSVGARILLLQQWECDRRCDRGIHRDAGS